MIDRRIYDYLLKYSKKYSLSDLKKHLVNSGQNKNAVDEAAVAVISQMGRTKAMERNNPLPKNMSMGGIQKKTSATKPMQKKMQTAKPMAKKAVTKTSNMKMKNSNMKNMNAKPKSKKGVWILLIIFILLITGAAIWYFLIR